MQILTVSHPSPSKKRYVEPVVASDAPEQAAHEISAPPEATWLRFAILKSLGSIHCRRRPRGLLVGRRDTQQWPSPALSRCGTASCPDSLRAPTSRRGGARKLWLGLADRASQDTLAA